MQEGGHVGVGGRHAFFAVIGILVLALMWQSRALPWQGPPRILNRFFRIIRRAFQVLLLAIALWSLV
ncbi:MAG: hypothetical protein FJY46_13540 [Betaproteobacteria bacterium]|nr:hypothetical protein [Betaproteobacteria bacterium]